MALEKKVNSEAGKDNVFVELIFNIIIPTIVLSKMSGPERLGPTNALLVALAFPLGMMIFKFFGTRKAHFFSIVGFVSILLTGGLGLMKLEGIWFAVKEAAVPSIFAIVILGSMKTKTPLVRTMFFNEKLINIEKVDAALAEKNATDSMEKLLSSATVYFAASFVLSAVLNFALAIYLLKSPTGTAEFNAELAKMNALSFPIITIPCVIVMAIAFRKLIKGIEGITGLPADAIFKSGK